MKVKIIHSTAACVIGLLCSIQVLADPLNVRSTRIFAPVAGQIGTSGILERDGRDRAARVGVLAYCADLAPNAAALGLMAYQNGARRHNHTDGRSDFGVVDGSFNRQGQFGAQNLVDMLMYDDGIPRFTDVVLVDGDRDMPTGQELLENFDVVIAYTDNKCGIPIPEDIADHAARSLRRFVRGGGGLVLTGFAFNEQIGFGDAIFRRGLSPFRKTDAGLDGRCSRPGPLANPSTGEIDVFDVPGPCAIGRCPAPCTPQFPGFPENPDPTQAKICLDSAGVRCENTDTIPSSTDPLFQPFPVTPDKACDHMLSLVDGPTISSWATALTEADVDPTATLCFNYDNIEGTPLPFLAINADRNIVALNTFPPDAHDINKFWYQCQVGNAIQYAAGNQDKCRDERGCNDSNPPPLDPTAP